MGGSVRWDASSPPLLGAEAAELSCSDSSPRSHGSPRGGAATLPPPGCLAAWSTRGGASPAVGTTSAGRDTTAPTAATNGTKGAGGGGAAEARAEECPALLPGVAAAEPPAGGAATAAVAAPAASPLPPLGPFDPPRPPPAPAEPGPRPPPPPGVEPRPRAPFPVTSPSAGGGAATGGGAAGRGMTRGDDQSASSSASRPDRAETVADGGAVESEALPLAGAPTKPS